MADTTPTLQFQPDGVLGKLAPPQMHLLIGEVASLMMASKVHRHLQVRDIADIMLPALNLNQFRIYRKPDHAPVALVTWAYFSAEVEKAYLGGRALLSEAERTSGDILYITDFIAPYGHAKQVIRDLRTNVFPNAHAKALRFVEHGKTRPTLWHFYGVNYQRPLN
jgi:cytolysin-activating lysine-acyltransferase